METKTVESGTVKRSKGGGLVLRVSLFVRSFFLQAVWNPRGMQNVGFCFALMPVARLFSEPERQKFMMRHLGFFNTNPTMASYVIGAVARAEVEGRGILESDDVKLTMGGPLGMAGDSLMWGAIRPAAGLVAALIAVSVLYGRSSSIWLAPAVQLAMYNVPHLLLRARGIWVGYRLGPVAAVEVTGRGFRTAVTTARGLAAFAAGMILAQVVIGGGAIEVWPLVGALLLLSVASLAVRWRFSASVVGLVGGLMWLALVVRDGNGG